MILISKSSMSLPSVSISFSGCAFLGLYHIGSVACIVEKVKGKRLRVHHALGSSSGAIAATALVLNVPVDIVKSRFLEITKKGRDLTLGAFNPAFNVNKLLGENLNEILSSDAHIIASGNLTIALTNKMMKTVTVSEFASRQDLIDCIVCSCFLPGFSGFKVPKFKDQHYYDGGLTNNQPVLDEKTIRVSAFAGNADISPNDHQNAPTKARPKVHRIGGEEIELSRQNLLRLQRAMVPPSDSILLELFESGYQDTKRYLESDALEMHVY